MSRFTLEQLHFMSLHGYCGDNLDQNLPWHYESPDDGNLYVGAVPPADVIRRLFARQAVEVAWEGTNVRGIAMENDMSYIMSPYGADEHDKQRGEGRIHQYAETLVNKTREATAGKLGIRAAVAHPRGRWGSVCYSTNASVWTCGVEHRSFAQAFDSLTGEFAMTWKLGNLLAVCDNTFDMMVREQSENAYKVKHTRHSAARVTAQLIGDALGVLESVSSEWSRQIEGLCNVEVGAATFDAIMARIVPVPAVGAAKSSHTRSDNLRDAMRQLWESDKRVTPWKGTAFGVLQMANTYHAHERGVRGDTSKLLRQTEEFYSGAVAANDKRTLAIMADVVTAPILAIAGAN